MVRGCGNGGIRLQIAYRADLIEAIVTVAYDGVFSPSGILLDGRSVAWAGLRQSLAEGASPGS